MAMIDAEELKLRLLNQKTTIPRFSIPYSEADTAKVLEAAYESEVRFRHRNYQADEATKSNIAAVAKLLCDESKFGIMLCGNCGNGKTTMMYAVRNLVNYLSRMGAIIIGNTRPELEVMDAMSIVKRAKDDELMNIATKQMLGIDDLGNEPAEVMNYGNVVSPLAELLEIRYKRQLYTIVTTNLTPKQVREKYGARVADRLNEMFGVVIFKNSTYRK